MSNIRFTKLVIFVNALVPLLLLLWDVYHKNVGANPQEFAIRTTGMMTLVFLTITIAITPIRKVFGTNSLVKLRRMVGLFAFFYGVLHLTTYVWFDRLFNLKSVVRGCRASALHPGRNDCLHLDDSFGDYFHKQHGQTAGREGLGRLHRLVYVAAVAGVLHFWMLVKSDTRQPLTFAFIIGLLLAHRILSEIRTAYPGNKHHPISQGLANSVSLRSQRHRVLSPAE
jgi:sulfoxide reductase heme-binding subunit YedZ